MVVGMLTSPDTQTSSPSVEEDGGSSLTALRPAHHTVHHPDHHAVHHPIHHSAAAFHRSDVPGSSMTARMDHSDRSEFSEQQRETSAERSRTESREDGDERRRGPSEDQTTRSSKRKLMLTSLSSGSHDASEAQDYEDKDPGSPPPAKRWVIGPIFQSFKSKMASFAEIVMSPVRLFKPSEFPAESNPEVHEDREEVETDGKKDVFSEKKKKLIPLRKLEVVQRLRFDTDSSNASDSEQNKVAGSQNRSERRGDSISEDAASFGSLNSPSETSENVSSEKSGQKLIVLCEQMTTDELKKHTLEKKKYHPQGQTLKKPRLPTPAIGKTIGPKRRELVVMIKRAGTEGTIGTGGAAESPKLTTLENPALVQTGKRRRVQVSGESLSSTCNTGDVQSSCNSLEREQKVLPRSRRKKEKGVKSSSIELMGPNVTSDSTPLEGPLPSASVTWTSSRATRQQKNREREKSADLAELLSSSSRTSELKRVRRNDVRQTRHKSNTTKNTRGKKNTDPFEDQGMSMSLTLKVGSGVDEGMETSSIMTCKRMIKSRNAEQEHDVLTDPSRPSRTTPEDLFGTEDDQSADYGPLEKNWLVCLDRGVKQDELEQEELCFTSTRCSTNPLKRSLSCPDISLQPASDVAPSAPFIDDKTLCYPPSPPKRAPDSTTTAPSPVKRTRRHTVCSVEIEREIAPLCLRKEVYPAWGSSKPGYSHPHSPSKSLSSLISRFLSSPLAFRSTKSSRGHADDSGYAASRSDLAIASSSSPSPISLRSPAFSSSAGESAFFSDAPHTPGQASVSSQCSGFDSVSMEAAEAVIQQGSEGNQRSSLISEEKALSDSEIKPDNKQVERRKVSSIRIRKTLPKPQYNLTPMGLPKAVRIKKKVFSVEEIYTNKNFSKPPEGRLETIFEVPLSRRDGSQSLIGPKRLKRFVEFPELGVARKPRRPLVGGAGGGGAQRKAAGISGTGRTRRGREEEAVHVQDFDSLLCSKLDELDLWMATEDLVY